MGEQVCSICCYRSQGAFTPDANEELRANYLHVKSMQRRDRQSCGANYAARIERLKGEKI